MYRPAPAPGSEHHQAAYLEAPASVLEVELEPLAPHWEQAPQAADLPQAVSKDLPFTALEAFRAGHMAISLVPHKAFMDLTQY